MELSSRALYAFFVAQGVFLLFPWNSLLSAVSYYTTRLESIPLATRMASSFALIFTTIKIVFVLVSSLLVNVISPEKQVIVSGLCNAVVFGILAYMPATNQFSDPVFFALTLILAFLAAICASFASNGTYAILGCHPPRCFQALENGQGLSGVVCSVIKILTILITHSPTVSANETIIYYAFSALVIGVCTLLFISVQDKLIAPESVQAEKEFGTNEESLFSQYLRTFGKLRAPAFAVSLCFTVTLAIFPSFYFSTRSIHASSFYHERLFPFVNLFLFNVGDWIGKSLPLVDSWRVKRGHTIFLLALGRLVYLPFYLSGNVHLVHAEYPLWTGLASDNLFYFLSITFGLSNGYVATCAMMQGPSSLPTEDKDRRRAGSVMVAFLNAGLWFGAVLSFVLFSLLESAVI